MGTSWEVCPTCGAVVADTDAHAAWHTTVEPKTHPGRAEAPPSDPSREAPDGH